MSIIRWSPGDMFGDADEMYNRLQSFTGQSIKPFIPLIDVYETDKAVVVEVPLTGVKPEEMEVNVERGILTLKGETKREHEVDENNYYRKEVRSGSFFREISLPTPVVEEKVAAEFFDGVLKITCPKAKPTTKKVNVKIIKKDKK